VVQALERCVEAWFDIPQTAATVLAVVEGADHYALARRPDHSKEFDTREGTHRLRTGRGSVGAPDSRPNPVRGVGPNKHCRPRSVEPGSEPNGAAAMEWPDAGVSRVPFRIYTDAEIYQQEQERIFRGEAWVNWQQLNTPTQREAFEMGAVLRVEPTTDDVAIDRVELWVDGVNTNVISQVPPQYPVSAPDLDPGGHTVEIRAYDVQGTPASATLPMASGVTSGLRPCARPKMSDMTTMAVPRPKAAARARFGMRATRGLFAWPAVAAS
jgi:hypothetical protein